MATPTDCLPWWHSKFDAYRGQRIPSGCYVSEGNVQCSPEAMRAAAEARMQRSISLEAYSLARNIASEVGHDATTEEKVALAESTFNQAKLIAGGDVNGVLLFKPSMLAQYRGYYGPIYAAGSTDSAPFGRWTSSHADPDADEILIAEFVLNGESGDFTRGANDQVGGFKGAAWVRNDMARMAQGGRYWVGPLPGVDHWKLFLYGPADAAEGAQRYAAADAALNAGRPDWSGFPVCSKPIWKPVVVGLSGIFFVGVVWWALSRFKKVPPRYEFPWMGPDEYESYKAQSEQLNNRVNALSAKLRSFPRGPTGLTPDDVKNTDAYREAKRSYAVAFKKLQDFNKQAPREYQRRASRERHGLV